MRELEERTEILVSRNTNNTLTVSCNSPTSRTKDILEFFDIWSPTGGFYKNNRLWCCEMPIAMEDILFSAPFKAAFSRIGVSIITNDALITNEKDKPNKEDVFAYLDLLKENGNTNMYGTAPYIEDKFGVNKTIAEEYIGEWMDTVKESQTQERD